MPLEGPVCLDLTGTEYVECSVGTDPVMKLIGELMGIDNTTAIGMTNDSC
jgi:hypothetical protein